MIQSTLIIGRGASMGQHKDLGIARHTWLTIWLPRETTIQVWGPKGSTELEKPTGDWYMNGHGARGICESAMGDADPGYVHDGSGNTRGRH